MITADCSQICHGRVVMRYWYQIRFRKYIRQGFNYWNWLLGPWNERWALLMYDDTIQKVCMKWMNGYVLFNIRFHCQLAWWEWQTPQKYSNQVFHFFSTQVQSWQSYLVFNMSCTELASGFFYDIQFLYCWRRKKYACSFAIFLIKKVILWWRFKTKMIYHTKTPTLVTNSATHGSFMAQKSQDSAVLLLLLSVVCCVLEKVGGW